MNKKLTLVGRSPAQLFFLGHFLNLKVGDGTGNRILIQLQEQSLGIGHTEVLWIIARPIRKRGRYSCRQVHLPACLLTSNWHPFRYYGVASK